MAVMSPQTRRLYEFGPFRLDAQERLLRRDEEIVPLTPKAFDMLLALVENSGRLLGKQELMQRLWPDSFVEEGSLAQNVSLLRRALGENLEGAKFIETVPRRGYRFIATVRGLDDADFIEREHSPTDIAVKEQREPEISKRC
jgi:DNA-binding winged helix-turn-helix (wHTH) protein